MELALASFKERLNQVNELIYFDSDQFLREKTTDPTRLKSFIDEAESLLNQTTKEADRFFLKGTIGNLYRVYGIPEQALFFLKECVHLAQVQKNPTREIISFIRFGEALKYNNDHEKALASFNEALALCHTHEVNSYLDFALQHKGKCLMELARYGEAKACFTEARSIRQAKGNQSLIDSTDQALKLLSRFMN